MKNSLFDSRALIRVGLSAALFSFFGPALRADGSAKPPVNKVFATITGFNQPIGLAVSPDNNTVYVVNSDVVTPGLNSLAVVDAMTNQIVVPSLFVGLAAVEVALSKNGHFLYVSDAYLPGFMTIVDTADLHSQTINNLGAAAFGISVVPGGKEVFIADSGSDTVDVYDIAQGKLLPQITVGNNPNYFAFSPDGKTAYVTNAGDSSVSVIDVKKGMAAGAAISVGNNPGGISITPNGKKLYTVNATTVSVIDTVTQQVTPINLGNETGFRAAMTRDGKYLYVPVYDLNNPKTAPGAVFVISTATDQVVGTPVPVGIEPQDVVIAPNGKRAYVSNYVDGTVTVIAISK